MCIYLLNVLQTSYIENLSSVRFAKIIILSNLKLILTLSKSPCFEFLYICNYPLQLQWQI